MQQEFKERKDAHALKKSFMKGPGVLVEEGYNLDSGRGRDIPFKDHRISQEQSFKSESTAYSGNRKETS